MGLGPLTWIPGAEAVSELKRSSLGVNVSQVRTSLPGSHWWEECPAGLLVFFSQEVTWEIHLERMYQEIAKFSPDTVTANLPP